MPDDSGMSQWDLPERYECDPLHCIYCEDECDDVWDDDDDADDDDWMDDE